MTLFKHAIKILAIHIIKTDIIMKYFLNGYNNLKYIFIPLHL